MDVFSKNYNIGSRSVLKREHVFGRVELSRGEWSGAGETAERRPNRFDDGPRVQRYVQRSTEYHVLGSFTCLKPHSSKRKLWLATAMAGTRRTNLPLLQSLSTNSRMRRFATSLLFPLLDSFPSILRVGSGQAKRLAVYSGLSTTTAVADQVRTLEQLVRRMVSLDERESLCNGLQTVAEEYVEGWEDTGTDSENDE